MTTSPAVELTVERVRAWLKGKPARAVVDDRNRPLKESCGRCVLETYLVEHGAVFPSVVAYSYQAEEGGTDTPVPLPLQEFIYRIDQQTRKRDYRHNLTAAVALRILNEVAPEEQDK